MFGETISTRAQQDADHRPAPAPKEPHRRHFGHSPESRAALRFFVCAMCHSDTCECYARPGN